VPACSLTFTNSCGRCRQTTDELIATAAQGLWFRRRRHPDSGLHRPLTPPWHVVYEVTATAGGPLPGWGRHVVSIMSRRSRPTPTAIHTPQHGTVAGQSHRPRRGTASHRVPWANEQRPRHPRRLQRQPSTAACPSFPIVPPVLDGMVFEQTPRQKRLPVEHHPGFHVGMVWAPSARTTIDLRAELL